MPRITRVNLRRGTAALVAACALGATVTATATPATAAKPAKPANAPASHQVPLAEQRAVAKLDHARVAKLAKPAALPTHRQLPLPHGIDGPGRVPARVNSIAPADRAVTSSTAAASTTSAAAATGVNGVLWPGGYSVNPNRQVGKLYFDINPSPTVTDYRHCTATAINSENKSLVLTAGHCVYDFANRRWYTNLWFYPGYENGNHLGAWSVRNISTTGNYFSYGTYADDMAVALVNRDSAGVPLVTRVGGHGIAFNQPVNVTRTSFGYPQTDTRWPGFTASGNDLYYCQGVDTYYSTGTFAGQMLLPCRMTGGASGGPWLSSVASTWMGTVTSVNSNKGGVGSAYANYMFGPYMGAQEQAVFQAYRAG